MPLARRLGRPGLRRIRRVVSSPPSHPASLHLLLDLPACRLLLLRERLGVWAYSAFGAASEVKQGELGAGGKQRVRWAHTPTVFQSTAGTHRPPLGPRSAVLAKTNRAVPEILVHPADFSR